MNFFFGAPVCREASHAKRADQRDFVLALRFMLRTMEVLKICKPRLWAIEQPFPNVTTQLTAMDAMTFTDTAFCQYGRDFKKSTRIYNNFGLRLKKCDHGTTKHAVRLGGNFGGRTGTYNKARRKGMLPEPLAVSIFDQTQILLNFRYF